MTNIEKLKEELKVEAERLFDALDESFVSVDAAMTKDELLKLVIINDTSPKIVGGWYHVEISQHITGNTPHVIEITEELYNAICDGEI